MTLEREQFWYWSFIRFMKFIKHSYWSLCDFWKKKFLFLVIEIYEIHMALFCQRFLLSILCEFLGMRPIFSFTYIFSFLFLLQFFMIYYFRLLQLDSVLYWWIHVFWSKLKTEVKELMDSRIWLFIFTTAASNQSTQFAVDWFYYFLGIKYTKYRFIEALSTTIIIAW